METKEKNKNIEIFEPIDGEDNVAVRVNGATVALRNKEVTVFFRDTRQETMEKTSRLWSVFSAGLVIGMAIGYLVLRGLGL